MTVITFERPRKLYNAKFVSGQLNIAESTLRTYTGHFRKYGGYKFTKQNRNVMYSDEDIQRFKKMLQLHKEGYGTIQECVSIVCEQSYVVSPLPIKQEKTNTVTLEVFQSIVNNLEEQIKHLHQYVDGRIEQRDKVLLETVREIQALKQIKQKKWWMFWR